MAAVSEARMQRIACIRKSLSQCASFITEFFDLANAHPCDFIVRDHWNRLIPKHVQKQLFQLSRADLKMLLTSQHQEFDVHSCRTDFDEDITFMPSPGDNEIKKTNIGASIAPSKDYGGNLTAAPASVAQGQTEDQHCSGEYHESQPGHDTAAEQTAWGGRSLDQFLWAARTKCLENLSSVCTSSEMLLSWLKEGVSLNQDETPFVGALMKVKKELEVETMAAVCLCLFHKCSADVVVDLGSGKGYLSTHLALHSGLPVVGIDSQASNTASAMQRAEKLGVKWNYLVKNELNKHTEKGMKDGTKLESKCTNVRKEEMLFDKSRRHIGGMINVLKESNSVEAIPEDYQEEDVLDVPKAQAIVVNGAQPELSVSLEGHHYRENAKVHPEQSSIRLPSGVTEVTVSGTLQNLSLLGTASKSGSDASRPNMLAALTMFIGQNTSLGDVVCEAASSVCPGKNPEKLKVLLTGLHTCGGLGSDMLRLFVKDIAVTSMCAVGCCYQLMQEKFSEDCVSDEKVRATHDFPMSSFLLARKVQLGRSACNLASLSLPRMRHRKELQGQTFYPRALLQAIIHEKIGMVPPNLGHLRNLSKRATDPCDYVVKALRRLNLPGCQA